MVENVRIGDSKPDMSPAAASNAISMATQATATAMATTQAANTVRLASTSPTPPQFPGLNLLSTMIDARKNDLTLNKSEHIYERHPRSNRLCQIRFVDGKKAFDSEDLEEQQKEDAWIEDQKKLLDKVDNGMTQVEKEDEIRSLRVQLSEVRRQENREKEDNRDPTTIAQMMCEAYEIDKRAAEEQARLDKTTEIKTKKFQHVTNTSWQHLLLAHQLNQTLLEEDPSLRCVAIDVPYRTLILTRLPAKLGIRNNTVEQAEPNLILPQDNAAKHLIQQYVHLQDQGILAAPSQKTIRTARGMLLNVRVKGRVLDTRIRCTKPFTGVHIINKTHAKLQRNIDPNTHMHFIERLLKNTNVTEKIIRLVQAAREENKHHAKGDAAAHAGGAHAANAAHAGDEANAGKYDDDVNMEEDPQALSLEPLSLGQDTHSQKDPNIGFLEVFEK